MERPKIRITFASIISYLIAWWLFFSASWLFDKIIEMIIDKSFNFSDFLSCTIMVCITIVFGLGLLYCSYENTNGAYKKRLKELRKKQAEETGCVNCLANERVTSELSYCEKCLTEVFDRGLELAKETEEKIRLSKELGLEGQAEGAKVLFWQKLPQPMKEILENQIFSKLREHFPKAKKFYFYSSRFSKHLLDSADTGVNIPVEGLELLQEINLQKLT